MIPNELIDLIRNNEHFCIAAHERPEGDAIGATVALGLGLRKAGKTVYLFNKDGTPEGLRFLPYSEDISTVKPSRAFDALIIVDCNSLKRVGVDGFNAKRVAVIDHHLSESGYGDIRWIDSHAVATGELIYKLFQALSIEIDKDIAVNLYTSIFTDTGGFKYSNTKPDTLRIASDLMETGINTWAIVRALYENVPFRRLKLLSLALQTLEKNDSVAWLTVTTTMYGETGAKSEDTEEFVNYARSIQGVEVGVFFREVKQGLYKISLRSKETVNVAAIAETYGGGGHFNASGCTVEGSLEEVQAKILAAVQHALPSKSCYLCR